MSVVRTKRTCCSLQSMSAFGGVKRTLLYFGAEWFGRDQLLSKLIFS